MDRVLDVPTCQRGAENLDEEHTCSIDSVEGQVPSDLLGTFIRNGPGRQRIGGQPYGHWFDGDGMLSVFSFTGDRVHFKRRVNAEEIGSIVSTAPVVTEGGAELPPAVNFAAVMSLLEGNGDGILVTNHLMVTKTRGVEITYEVEIWGRQLVLNDLGVMSQERADRRGRTP